MKINNAITSTYNQISDVFSRTQVKRAVESLSTYSQRLKLIDNIIDRRQEIRNADDVAKIQQYSHIFRKMLQRYKKKKGGNTENDIAKQKMNMVMQLFRSQKKEHIDDIQQEQFKKKQIQINRRNALPKNKEIIFSKDENQKEKLENQIILSDDKVLELSSESIRLKRFFTEKDPTQVEKQIEDEIYEFLKNNKGINQEQREQFLRLSDKSQFVRQIESKVKHKLILQDSQKQQQEIKNKYQIKQLFKKKFHRGETQIKLPKSFLMKCEEVKIKEPLTSRKQYFGEDSYASFTEIKLNKLYQESACIQKTLKFKTQSCPNKQLQSYLVNTNKDIIDISNNKLFHI